MNGVDPVAMMEIAGHRQLATTQGYAHMRNKTEHLEESMTKAVGRKPKRKTPEPPPLFKDLEASPPPAPTPLFDMFLNTHRIMHKICIDLHSRARNAQNPVHRVRKAYKTTDLPFRCPGHRVPQLNWLERRTVDPEAGGSSPLVLARLVPRGITGLPGSFLGCLTRKCGSIGKATAIGKRLRKIGSNVNSEFTFNLHS